MQLSGAIVAKLALVLFAVGTDAAVKAKETLWNEHADSLNKHANGRQATAKAEAALVEVKKHLNNRTSSFYSKLNEAGATYLFTKITGAKSINDYTGVEVDQNNQLVKGKENGSSLSFKPFAEKITVNEIAGMPTEVCQVFINALEYISTTTSNKIPDECRKAYLNNLAGRKVRLSTVSGIPSSWISASGNDVVKGVIANGAHATQKLNSNTFKEIVKTNSDKSNDYCELFSVQDLNGMTKDQRKAMQAICFAKVRGIDQTTINYLADYPDSIFSAYNGAVAAQTLAAIDAEKLKQFASKSEDENKCINLALGLVRPNAIPSITADCLKGYLNGDLTARTVFLNGKMSKIPSATFKEIKGEDLKLFGNFSASEMKYMSVEVVQYIMDNELAIESLPDSYAENVFSPFEASTLKSIKITPANFKALAERAPSVAGTLALKATTLDDQVFSLLEADTIKDLTAAKTNETVIGYTLLNAMNVPSRTNYKAIVQNMGTKANTNFLTTISSYEEYAEMTWLHPLMNESMVSSIGFEITPAIAKKSPELVNNVEETWKNMLEDKDTKWGTINKGTFAVFTNSKDFCEALLKEENKEVLEQIPVEALRVMSAECTFILREVLDVNTLPKLADNALAFFKSSDVKIELNKLTVPQITYISANVADNKDSFFAKSENIEKINALDNARFAAISPKQFSQMSDEVIKGVVSIEKVKVITPENFAGITDAQLAVLPEEVLKAISVAQIAEMVNFATLDKNAEKLSQEQKDAIKGRKEKLAAIPVVVIPPTASATSESSSNVIYYGLIGFGAIIIVAGIVFVIVRRK